MAVHYPTERPDTLILLVSMPKQWRTKPSKTWELLQAKLSVYCVPVAGLELVKRRLCPSRCESLFDMGWPGLG